MRMFKQQVKLVFFLSIRKMHSLLPSHKQLFLGNTICNALYKFLMSLPCIRIQIIQIFSSLQADQQARCVNQSKKNLMLTKQVISLPAMEALTVNNISRQHASPFEFQLFHLASTRFWEKCENKFRLDTQNFLFLIHAAALWMSLGPYPFHKNCFFPSIFIICLRTLYLCDPMISCLLA